MAGLPDTHLGHSNHSDNANKNSDDNDLLRPSKKPPCRTCVDFKTWMKQTNKQSPQQTHAQSGLSGSSGGQHQADAQSSKPVAQAPTETVNHECPLDINELGRNTWSFLHTMAANYPDKPSSEDQSRVKTFMSSFSYLYPCEMCAYDFRRRMKKEPVQTDDRHQLSQWLCRMHNQINTMLGKNTFDCSKVDERWKDGWDDGSCG